MLSVAVQNWLAAILVREGTNFLEAADGPLPPLADVLLDSCTAAIPTFADTDPQHRDSIASDARHSTELRFQIETF